MKNSLLSVMDSVLSVSDSDSCDWGDDSSEFSEPEEVNDDVQTGSE